MIHSDNLFIIGGYDLIMAFSKTFPRQQPGSNYPLWEEIYLTDEEERHIEEDCRQENFQILNDCLHDAKVLAIKHSINTDENVAQLAIALFEKRASHAVYWKENLAKDKFDAKK